MPTANTPDFPDVPPERDLVSRYPELLDPGSSLYLVDSKSENADGSTDHLVSGVRLVFSKAHDVNGLYGAYHRDPGQHKLPDQPTPKDTVRNLTVCADELVICGELCLPETNVRIFARSLVFKAENGTPGRLNTSPLPLANPKAGSKEDGAGMDGAHGRKAGDIELYVAHFEAEDPSANRFCLRGSKGQGAGAGADGVDGNELVFRTDYTDAATYDKFRYTFNPPAVYFRVENDLWGPHGATIDSWPWGCNSWPKDGTDAKPPGKPGNGGNGGNFFGVLPAWAIETLPFSRPALTMSAAAQLTQFVRSCLQATIQRATLLETQTASEVPPSVPAAAQEIEASLRQADDALAVAQPVATGNPALAAALAQLRRRTHVARKKNGYILAVDDPGGRQGQVTVHRNAAQVRMGAEGAERDLAEVMKCVTAVPSLVDTSGDAAGEQAADVRGGMRGVPYESAKYDIRCWTDPVGGVHSSWCRASESHTTKAGTSFQAPAADRPAGNDGGCDVRKTEEFGSAWLHPALLQTVLLYVRDAYLTSPVHVHRLAPILREYVAALQSLPAEAVLEPILARSGRRYDDSLYSQGLAETATLLHRIESQLDYFGNPAGWTPLFSLPYCLRLYEQEVREALRTLILARWVQTQADRVETAQRLAGQSIESLHGERERALAQIERQQDNLRQLKALATALDQEVTGLEIKMQNKRQELTAKAEEQARDAAWINLGVSTLSGLCQVIPYGQPALGALGSAGKVIADNVIKGDDPVKSVGPLTNLLTDLTKTGLDAKAAQIIEAAKEAKEGSKEAPSAAEKAAEATAARLTHVGKSLGPALSGIADSVAGLNVPESEVNTRLSKLLAESPEFRQLAGELEGLNIRKAEFSQQLGESLQILSSAYARVTSSVLAVNALERQRRDNRVLLDHEARLHVKAMDQGARFMLVKYLYYLARCYEYAVLEPVTVNYQLASIFDKITPLVAGQDIGQAVTGLADDLAPLFKTELRAIEDKLKSNFRPEYTGHLQIRLSRDQTPEIMAQLNATGEAVIHLRDFNCILPRYERIKIADVEVESLTFKADGTALPTSGSVDFTLEPLGDGTLRAGNALYVVRHPTTSTSATVGQDSQQIWGVTYHFGDRGRDAMDRIGPSQASLELLDSLLGSTDRSMREKMAKPAAWTAIKVLYSRHVRAPDLEAVLLKWCFNWTKADDSFCVLDVRLTGREAPPLECSPDDVNGRGRGFGDLYRIYPRGTRVELRAPPVFGARVFDRWEVIDNTDTMISRDVREATLRLERMDHHMQVSCWYRDGVGLHAAVCRQPAPVHELIRAHVSGLGDGDRERFERSAEFLQFQACGAGGQPAGGGAGRQCRWGTVLYNEPAGIPVGPRPRQAAYTELQAPREVAGRRWLMVDYQGSVGWLAEAGDIQESGQA